MLALALGGVFMFGALALSYSGIRLRTAVVSAATVEEEKFDMRAPDIFFPASEASAGPVTFRHSTHGDLNNRNCASCHSGQFNRISEKLVSQERPDMHGQQYCGSCHNGEKAFSVDKGCLKCHAVK
jgi:c(7)-type cytochrome triheme protein